MHCHLNSPKRGQLLLKRCISTAFDAGAAVAVGK
ncbi:hypothetical protein ES707_19241 [subsurface metagenome]